MHSLQQKSPITPTPPRHSGFYAWNDGPALGYFVLRLVLGINMLMHGLTRVLNYDPTRWSSAQLGVVPHRFAASIVDQFKETPLPVWSVQAFAYSLPYVELMVGVLMVLGLLTRTALVLGGLTIAALTFGTTLRQEWASAGSQLIYAVVFFLLLAKINWNVIALDRKLTRGGFIEGIEIGE